MSKPQAKNLFEKYQTGQSSAEERAIVENWLTFGEATGLDLTEAELDADLLELRQRLQLIRVKKQRLWPRMLGIAAAVATIVFGVWFFAYRSATSDSLQTGVYANDIAPGKNGATVTLSTGEVIQLDSTKQGVTIDPTSLTYDDGTRGAGFGLKAETEVQMTAATTRGQTYIFTLPDGSKVWLNAATTLKFPSTFANKISREVEVDGEAYFEVFKNKSQPFVVKTKKLGNTPEQEIMVLGTHFNVNSYGDEPAVFTTLMEGSVKVAAGSGERTIVPGEQARNRNGQISVAKVDAESVMDWKEGDFNLENVDFRSAMRKIARWYDVEVVYDQSVPESIEAGGWISRNSKLSSILKLIENSGLVKFKIEGKKVYVYR